MNTQLTDSLLADIRALIERRPVLVWDLVDALRTPRTMASGRRYMMVGGADALVPQLHAAGLVLRSRPHRDGVAIYVWHSPFSQVSTGRGKTAEVQ